ncbi:MAG: serine/threonine protein kinase [Verrucomicrobiaceae bacterium]|nr:MAG: serine/threonine protein kinase [Verrucomicrobiaceae bacterium]
MSHLQEIEEALFEAVSVIETAEARQAFVDLVRAGDSSQSTRLAAMLEAKADADFFFRKAESSRTVIAAEAGEELIDSLDRETLLEQLADPAGEEPGEKIGRYRLLQRIGEGGCGVVYLAEQLEPVRRQVALKVIRMGMDTEKVIARFELERQSLALMDHPNIARVLDAGATETGRPYFVMEWVRGLRITEYCDNNRLDVRQRIDLFIEVCQAIQHAHQKGVLHRDIKPSNVLVSQEGGKPVPKVIDFGVGKAIENPSRAGTALTLHDQFVGTPAYMSPEQADQKHQDIDTRSDVYGLGILLYELLAGRTPFDSKELTAVGITEMRRILTEREPAAPSVSFGGLSGDQLEEVASLRASEPAKLIATVRGDLDSVVMKAIEKDRHLRYETVNGFIMDLQRYIADQPVIARPAKRMYLFRKFVRRNRLVVGAAAGVLLSLVVGMGTAFTYYVKERHGREEQFRLRKLAEAAHGNELQRLAEAREWESFAHVSVLLSEGKTGEADEQLRQTPLSLIKLTPRSAGVLRSLGNWNALRGRWQQGVECFHMLLKSEDLNRSEDLTTSLDLVAIGCVFLEGGQREDYINFRTWAVERYGNSDSVIDVSRLLHSILLLDTTDAATLKKLERLKPVLEGSQFDMSKIKGGWEWESAIWRAFGIALLEYRQGNYQKSRYWAEVGMGFKSGRDYISGALDMVRAMAAYKLGDVKTAKEDLRKGRARIEKAFAPDLPAAYEPLGQNQGFWWDWIILRILFREAEQLIEPGDRS